MRRVTMEPAEEQLRLDASITGLASKVPVVSAQRLLSPGQRLVAFVLAACLALGAVVSLFYTVMAVLAIITVLYLCAVGYRLLIFTRSGRPSAIEHVTDSEARAIVDADLPVYSVIVPAYREANVIRPLIEHLMDLEYPAHRLDVKILVEADDDETIAAAMRADPGRHFELIAVPGASPRTKPKALNFGLGLARGEFVTIFDAEDQPEPLQLRRAVVAFRRSGPEVACLQAKLSYSNPGQNIITRWFTLEYAMWFSLFLPGLASLRAPIPLGGTSNHFRRSHLRLIGGWDPFNVTEDADLGLRLAREGLEVRMLDSITFEEANSDFVNWVRQRSRWYKGYVQTFLIHVREPVELFREIGWRNVAQFVLFVGGTPFLALMNPLFWLLTILWFVGHPAFELSVFPAPIYYAGLLCWAFGNFAMVYITLMTCRVVRRPELAVAALTVWLYWVMMALAATKAAIQLIVAPTFWEKTVHGLNVTAEQRAVPPAA